MTVNQHLLSAIHTLAFAWSRSFPIVTSNLHKHSKDSSSLLLSSFTTQSCMMLSVNICTKTQWQWETRIGSNIKINHNRPFPNCRASFSKRGLVQNLSYENEFYLHMNENSFWYERLCTKTHFEKEAQGNSEMVYWVNPTNQSSIIIRYHIQQSPHLEMCAPKHRPSSILWLPKNIDFPL